MRGIKHLFLISLLGTSFLFIPVGKCPAQEKLLPVSAAMHISTNISDGKLSFPEILSLARQNHIQVIILGDHYDVQVRYGFWPLRSLLQASAERPSVRRYGVARYWQELERIQRENPDLIVIPGMEVTPFYRWEGNPFKHTLALRDWHKHMLVVGLGSAQDYQDLFSRRKQWGRWDPLSLWPLGLLGFGVLCLNRRARRFDAILGCSWGPVSPVSRGVGVSLILVSLIFGVNNFPFRQPLYPRYGDRSSLEPYQDLIDSVRKKQGLIFWAHPDMDNEQSVKGIKLKTRAYGASLLQTRDYTGFAILYEGYRSTGYPGGFWDDVLKEYCDGKRAHPVWAMSELDFESNGSFAQAVTDLKTVLLLRNFSRAAVIQALAAGQMYVLRGPGPVDPVLDAFSVSDPQSGAVANSGGEVAVSGKPQLRIASHLPEGEALPALSATIKIIRAGEIIKTIKATTPFDVVYEDVHGTTGMRTYYRLEIQYPQKLIITNPIFVRF